MILRLKLGAYFIRQSPNAYIWTKIQTKRYTLNDIHNTIFVYKSI